MLLLQAHVVSAFEQSLSNMTQRLQQLTATAERKVIKLIRFPTIKPHVTFSITFYYLSLQVLLLLDAKILIYLLVIK